MNHEFKARGHRWRVQSDDRGRFDEIVVICGKDTKRGRRDSGLMLHAEMMSDDSIFVDVAGIILWVWSDESGIARITCSEDRRPGQGPEVADLRDKRLDKKPRRRK